ncbi:MAG: glycosyltransferase [Oscillospiraceae bacterium]|nr:glycosyltransferase [Oscillospiraceae bacterium]
MKKAVCISCTHHYQERIAYGENALRKAGYNCTYITSDFHHTSKKRHQVDLPHCIQLPTVGYTKNLSFRRLYSHMRFAKDAMKAVADLKPDLLYVEVPPNSLCKEAAKYKKRNPNVKLVFDIFDMWPESFPSNKLKKLLKIPFGIWAKFRNKGLPAADLVFTECDLFQEALQPHLKGVESRTLHLCKPAATTEICKPLPQQETIHLCYLGSINNIIDIPAISALIGQVQALRPVVLHIIGDGETRDTLIESVEATGATVQFHGSVYDNGEKQAIFDMCSFGLNIMKDSVFIGLTMKSVDYFAGGLPIINSIGGDTRSLVETRQIGINLNRENPGETAKKIAGIDTETHLQMRNNTLSCFRDLLSEEVFSKNLISAI